jgi:hypothetical protein
MYMLNSDLSDARGRIQRFTEAVQKFSEESDPEGVWAAETMRCFHGADLTMNNRGDIKKELELTEEVGRGVSDVIEMCLRGVEGFAREAGIEVEERERGPLRGTFGD